MATVRQKRFQYWGSSNGIPMIKWSKWFNHNGSDEPLQFKGFKGSNLKNEYRITEE